MFVNLGDCKFWSINSLPTRQCLAIKCLQFLDKGEFRVTTVLSKVLETAFHARSDAEVDFHSEKPFHVFIRLFFRLSGGLHCIALSARNSISAG